MVGVWMVASLGMGNAVKSLSMVAQVFVEISHSLYAFHIQRQESCSTSNKFHISIDRGGTFTDCCILADSNNPDTDNGELSVIKLLSVDPDNYPDAPTEGIRRLLELRTGKRLPR